MWDLIYFIVVCNFCKPPCGSQRWGRNRTNKYIPSLKMVYKLQQAQNAAIRMFNCRIDHNTAISERITWWPPLPSWAYFKVLVMTDKALYRQERWLPFRKEFLLYRIPAWSLGLLLSGRLSPGSVTCQMYAVSDQEEGRLRRGIRSPRSTAWLRHHAHLGGNVKLEPYITPCYSFIFLFAFMGVLTPLPIKYDFLCFNCS